MRRTRRPVVALTSLAVTAAALAPAAADDGPRPGVDPVTLKDLGGLPAGGLGFGAVHRYSGGARVHELAGTISSVDVVETRGDDVVVTLASDLLFGVDSADLEDAARQRVTELAAEVPEGAPLVVDGHTDSVASEEYNLELSRRRAEAVAEVVRAARPDLVLEVRGHGETDPKVPESGEDVAQARAQNRRVELRHRASGPGATETTTRRLEPAAADHVPGEPRVTLPDPGAVEVEHLVEVPAGEDAGVHLRVGVEALVVRGPVARLRIQFAPVDGTAGRHVYGMTGQRAFWPRVLDTRNLRTYQQAARVGQSWETDTVYARTSADGVLRYETYVARPLDEVDTVDVSLVPEWPQFEDIPVVWD